jgi:hypothetical protein
MEQTDATTTVIPPLRETGFVPWAWSTQADSTTNGLGRSSPLRAASAARRARPIPFLPRLKAWASWEVSL